MFCFAHQRSFHRAILTCWQGFCILLACAFTSGCVNLGSLPKRQPPSSARQAPLDAFALSGGKITRFIPMPELLNSSTDKTFLLACRHLPLTSHTARSATVAVKARQLGNGLLNALVVGSRVFMLPGDLVRMGIASGDAGDGGLSLYPLSAEKIILLPGKNKASVGNQQITLKSPILRVDHQLVMEWADMLALLKERDRQRHQPPFIRSVQVFYTMREYENSVPPFGKP